VGQFEQAIAAIDAANADDPHTIVARGEERPKEQVHAELMTEWVQRLDPDADELQLLAARAHHLRRWVIPRSEFPDGRAGYLRWRRRLKDVHAEEVGRILGDAGYAAEEAARVQAIVRKDGLASGSDPAVQTHEDALCLVFLETQLDELAERLGDDHVVEVLRKTLVKMGEQGKRFALELPLGEHQRALLERALAGGD
jgi:hypothetical protein